MHEARLRASRPAADRLGCHSRSHQRGFHEQADDCARQDKLNIRTEASGAMPAAPAMKELAAVRTQLRKDVLKIRCGGRGRAQRGWVERPTRERQQRKSEQATSDF